MVLQDLLQARESGYVTVTVFIGIHRILDRVIKNKLNSRKEIGCRDTFDENSYLSISVNLERKDRNNLDIFVARNNGVY